MIIPMKKVVLLTLREEQDEALRALRKLGVMQVEAAGARESETTRDVVAAYTGALRAEVQLAKYEDSAHSHKAKSLSGVEAVEETLELLESRAALESERDTVARRRRELEVWGNFDRKALDELRGEGIVFTFCTANEQEYHAVRQMDHVEIHDVAANRGKAYFVAVTLGEPEPGSLPEFHLTEEDDPADLRRRAEILEQRLQALEERLEHLAVSLPAVRRRVSHLAGDVEYGKVYDALSEHGELAALEGFVPEPELHQLEAAAVKHGWGLLTRDPEADELVPVCVRQSKFGRLVAPLMNFLGIVPGYREIDASSGILVFFTVFFAMIIGDAGYGLIFLALSVFALLKFGGKPKAKAAALFFTILSVAAVIWGVMTNNYFGTKALDALAIPWMEEESSVQTICFTLAALQLSLGRIWKSRYESSWRAILPHIGWVVVLWANYIVALRLIVYPGPFPMGALFMLYGVGVGLVALFGVNWLNISDVFQFPFSIINSFVDLLSYIRLFAVGMAGYYIAISFNAMAVQLHHGIGIPVLGIAAGGIVILLGHLLNICLCFLGVLVHAVRLNALEFSGHIGISWSGSMFKPFMNHHQSEES